MHANQGQFGSEKIYTPSNAFISNLQSITNISTLFYVVLLSTGGLIPYFPVQYLEKWIYGCFAIATLYHKCNIRPSSLHPIIKILVNYFQRAFHFYYPTIWRRKWAMTWGFWNGYNYFSPKKVLTVCSNFWSSYDLIWLLGMLIDWHSIVDWKLMPCL